ncbi:hypothetical protein HK102_003447, partial [Quaeritorhiza haematococci]
MASSLTIIWPTQGIFISYLLEHPSARRRPSVIISMYLAIVLALHLSGHFTPRFSIVGPLPNLVSLPICACAVDRLISRFGGSGRRERVDASRTVIDLHQAKHMLLLVCGLLVGPFITATLSRLLLPVAMTNTMYAMWFCSDLIGDILVVPFCLLMEEIPAVLRRWQALWAYAILIAINLLYVILRVRQAGDTQLGLYLAFPWLLLMTHLFGAAGTYTGCLLTGFINAYTTAMMDDTQRNFYIHGHIFILFATCVCFIEIFRQRDEALNHVEQIVDERTAQLTKTMTQLAAAENKTQAALKSRTRFTRYLCHELKNPLHQIINLADSANEVSEDAVKPSLDNIRTAAMYMSGFIKDVLDLRQAEVNTTMLLENPNNTRTEMGETVDWVVSRLVACAHSVRPPVIVERQVDPEVEYAKIFLSKNQCDEMIRRLISYARVASPNPYIHVSLTASANDQTLCIKTSHPGSIATKEDLLELVMPFSTRPKSSWVPEYAGSGLSLSIVLEIVKAGGGRLVLRSFVNENLVEITILLPLGERPVRFLRNPLQVAIETSSQPLQSSSGRMLDRVVDEHQGKAEHCTHHRTHTSPSSSLGVATFPPSPSTPSELSTSSTPSTPSMPSTSSTPFASHSQTSSPISTRTTSQKPSPPPTTTRSTPASPSATILVVDDSVINRKILTRLFSLLNFKTLEAEDGQDALRKYAQSHSQALDIVMIMMDINMPVMDGFEATRRLRKLGCTVPIIAVTANLILDDTDVYFEAGITEIAPKPFMKQQAEELLKRHRLDQGTG